MNVKYFLPIADWLVYKVYCCNKRGIHNSYEFLILYVPDIGDKVKLLEIVEKILMDSKLIPYTYELKLTCNYNLVESVLCKEEN